MYIYEYNYNYWKHSLIAHTNPTLSECTQLWTPIGFRGQSFNLLSEPLQRRSSNHIGVDTGTASALHIFMSERIWINITVCNSSSFYASYNYWYTYTSVRPHRLRNLGNPADDKPQVHQLDRIHPDTLSPTGYYSRHPVYQFCILLNQIHLSASHLHSIVLQARNEL